VALTQEEADGLLIMAKEFVDTKPLEFPQTQPMRYERRLLSTDRREEFIFDLERGRRNRARLKYQTRGREVFILARLEISGSAHRNPPDSPYRPGERIACPHFHRYTEGFEARIAYPVADVAGLSLRDVTNGVQCLQDFLRYCHVQNVPEIQHTL